MAFMSLDAFAISKENERMAKQLINEYYALLQEYANRPLINNQYAIQQLFANPALNGSWVMNDLNILKGKANEEDDLGSFLSTFAHQDIEKLKVHFEYKIEDKSMKEQLVEIKDKNNTINYTNIWVWVDKTIMAEGHKPIKTRETFKIVNGKIEAITTPEKASYRINGIDLYNQKKYKDAFEIFENAINEGKASLDEYMYAASILWLDKTGKNYPKKVRDAMAIHYYAKSGYKDPIFKYWIIPLLDSYSYDMDELDFIYRLGLRSGLRFKDWSPGDILHDSKYFDIYFKETREWSYNQPFSQGLIRIGEKNKRTGKFEFGYLDIKGKNIIPYHFSEAHRFTKEGVALVRNKETQLFGLIDTKGYYVTKKGYIDAIPLHSDENSQLIAVKNENGKWGFINYKGEEVIPFEFDNAFNFFGDYADVKIGENNYTIDKTGRTIRESERPKGYDNPISAEVYSETSSWMVDYFRLAIIQEYPSRYYTTLKNGDFIKTK